jgi:predicted N-acetyltransferase YhbS
MNGRVKIRIADSSDARSLTSVINDAFRCAENFFVEKDRLDLEEVHNLLGTGKFLLAEYHDAVLGCVYVEPQLTTDGHRAYLGLLSVAPKHQQAGLGSELMNAAEDYCRGLGCRFMDIRVVNLRTELPGYYQRRGYVETGTGEFPPEIETKLPCHFIEMSKPLE